MSARPSDAQARATDPSIALGPLLFVSGAAALLLQVLWARDLALLFGATAVATAVVLFSFFAGLMLGAEIGGRLAQRHRGGALFAALECGVAVATLSYVVLVRPRLGGWAIAATDLAGPALHVAARAVLALAVLILPTTLIGATLPAAIAATPAGEPTTSARLYAWNTLGGAVGALGALLAIPTLGSQHSFLLAAMLDASVALVAWLRLRRTGAVVPGVAAAHASGGAPATPPDPPPPARLALVAALVGFAGLGDEVLWTRGLASASSNTVYSLAIVLAAVLLGLVAGARLAAWLARRSERAAPALALACIALAITTLLSREAVRALPRLADALAVALRVDGAGAGFAVEAMLGLLVVFAPSVCLGAVLPLCAARSGGRAARSFGRTLAANTAGGLLGAPLAAFVLLPALGVGGGLALTAGAVLIAALLAAERASMRVAVAGASVVLVLVVLVAPRVDLAWLGRYGAQSLLFYRDGAAATVLVTADARNQKRMLVNGQYSLGGTDGLLLERREAHLPLLLHPAPKRVLLLGVGTAATLGAALAHPGVRADAVEIVPEVVEAAALFAGENGAALGDDNAHLVLDDARSFLLATRQRYDVIVSDLFLPWTAGAAYLYSRETFALGRSRLAPGGLYCQWLPLHQLWLGDLQAIIATFADVFPHVGLWVGYHRASAPIVALVGSAEPIRLDVDALAQRLRDPALARAARGVGLDDPRDLALLYVTGGARLRAATAGAPILRDDRPFLEFSAPSAYFHQPGLARASVDWLAGLVEDTPVVGVVSTEARASLMAAQAALLRNDGPTELARYLDVLAREPGVPGPRRALSAIAASRRAAGDPQTAAAIEAALERAPAAR